ncbi:MAG TPA: hypothetical protein VIQ30_13480, partial [Pseudonocardia sp.]
APPRRPRPGTPLAARLLRVVRPGWSGIMMATIAARLLNVQIPTLVLVGLALAGALALGGAALTGDRKRQLDKRRGDASAALRSTVEEFRLSLGKQLRDASRACQQELRRESATAAARATAATNAELETVRRAAEDDRRSADELTTLARDLTALGARRRRALDLRARLTAGQEMDAPTASAAGSVTDAGNSPQASRDGSRVVRLLHVVA